jgi:hypothetical protein
MPRKFRYIMCSLCAVLFLSIAPGSARSQETPWQPHLFRYKISSHGINVGEMKTAISPVQRRGGHALRFQSDLAVDANLIVFRTTSRSHEDAVVSDQGTLSYRKRGEENGKSYDVEGGLDGGSFRFKLQENGAARDVLVPRRSYDYTTFDCPEKGMKREGETMELRLLDMERAVVVSRRYHFVKTEDVEVGDRTIRCKVVDFSDSQHSCRRWLASDGRGVIIVRQDGKGKGGTYSLRLVSLK